MGLRAVLPLAATVILVGCGPGSGEDGDGGTGLAFPLTGALDEDFFYVAMVDHAGAGAIEDYECGLKTYDGHTGTDIALPSFAAMDAGVAIRATLAGTVLETHDGEFDRNTSWVGQSGLGNYVALSHDNGLVSWYGHMKNGSVAVSPGDVVSAGDVLGEVGSSGRSDMPHLHLELQQDGNVLDPFAGPCGASASAWEDQDDYDLAFQALDIGLTDQTLSLDLVKQPPAPKGSFVAGDTLWVWVLVLNADQGEISEFAFYRPDGSHFDTYSFTHSEYFAASWWWVSYPVSGNFTVPGTWTVDYRYDGAVRTSSTFDITSVAPAHEADELAGFEPESGGGAL